MEPGNEIAPVPRSTWIVSLIRQDKIFIPRYRKLHEIRLCNSMIFFLRHNCDSIIVTVIHLKVVRRFKSLFYELRSINLEYEKSGMISQ